jgi:hypothetical protein
MKKSNILNLFFILNVSLAFCYNQSEYRKKMEESLERKKRQNNFDHVQYLKNLAFRFHLSILTHENFMNEIKGKDSSFIRKSKEDKLKKILSHCNDNSEGIAKVLSEFQRIFFVPNEMKNLFRDCGKYINVIM